MPCAEGGKHKKARGPNRALTHNSHPSALLKNRVHDGLVVTDKGGVHDLPVEGGTGVGEVLDGLGHALADAVPVEVDEPGLEVAGELGRVGEGAPVSARAGSWDRLRNAELGEAGD